MRPLFALLTLFAVGTAAAQPPAPEPQPGYGRGLVVPPDLPQRQRLNFQRQGVRITGLPRATEAEWDSREKGWVPPPRNQGNCGSCWNFAAVGAAEIAAVKAGKSKAPETDWSEQSILNCSRTGGCNGDWPETALEAAKNAGVPNESDVPYAARVQVCNAKIPRVNTIDDYGYVGPESGVPAVQAIKDAIKAYGSVSVAVAADTSFSNWRSGVFNGSGSTDINHAVILVGWKDDGTGSGHWIMRNSWGANWCEGGYMRIKYGANRIGYGAMYAVVEDVSPPTPPTPPTPPNPPTPGKGFTGTISTTTTYKDGVAVGPPVTTVGGGANAADGVETELKGAGVSPVVIADVLNLLRLIKTKAPRQEIMAAVLKLILDMGLTDERPAAAPACCGAEQPVAAFRREDPVSWLAW